MFSNRFTWAFKPASARLLACVALIDGVAAHAQVGSGGTISDGPTYFRQVDSPTSGTGNGNGGAVFSGSGSTGLDHLFQAWWWIRTVGVDTREFCLAGATSWMWSGSVGTLHFSNANWTAIARFTVTDRPAPEGGLLRCDLDVTNSTATEKSYALFQYLDLDVLGATGSSNDSAELVSANMIRIFDVSPSNSIYYQAPGAAAYQVTTWATLRGSLANSSVTELNGSGVPFGPADWTGGFQFNLTVPPGETRTATVYVGLNAVPIPPPPACAGDINGDRVVDWADADLLLANFGIESGATLAQGDVNGDGAIDLKDLNIMQRAYEIACP